MLYEVIQMTGQRWSGSVSMIHSVSPSITSSLVTLYPEMVTLSGLPWMLAHAMLTVMIVVPIWAMNSRGSLHAEATLMTHFLCAMTTPQTGISTQKTLSAPLVCVTRIRINMLGAVLDLKLAVSMTVLESLPTMQTIHPNPDLFLIHMAEYPRVPG